MDPGFNSKSIFNISSVKDIDGRQKTNTSYKYRIKLLNLKGEYNTKNVDTKRLLAVAVA